ncbi:hypothetical protein AVEN_267153-1 [Araneus ventricosus]|uniref:Uncharacterized protein n=1 Tax=Araneus ventricosus TaxID=182803 RepID=A0A4Y2ND94_ARAVE|nr:hypothetical protein AVEN_267153-1 [Araneus ventricosus]
MKRAFPPAKPTDLQETSEESRLYGRNCRQDAVGNHLKAYVSLQKALFLRVIHDCCLPLPGCRSGGTQQSNYGADGTFDNSGKMNVISIAFEENCID